MDDNAGRRRPARPVGDYVYRYLTADDREGLRKWMVSACGHGKDEFDEPYCTISNLGQCTPRDPPFDEDDLREMLQRFADARVDERADYIEWSCLVNGAVGRRHGDRVRKLFEAATGVTDEFVFAPAHDA